MAEAKLVPSKRGTSRARILVAEDDADLRRLVSAVLSHDGYDVLEVSDGCTMLEYLASSHCHGSDPDVIVSDVFMPGKSGLDVLVSLRELGIGSPVVLMTAFPDHCSEASAREHGAVTLIAKPFEIDDLRMIVLNLLPSLRKAHINGKPLGDNP